MTSEFTTVRTEGGLLPPDLLHRIAAADPDLGGFDPEKYGLQPADRVGEAASRAWARAKNYWAAFRSATEELPEGESGLTQTRAQWLQPLLRELGYRELQYDAAGEVIDERRFPRYYRSGPVPLHILTLRQSLDRVMPAGGGQRRASPHALMQEYLNLSDATYGIVSNGLQFRLLRDSASLTRQASVEFDLQAMMEGGVYADFVLLYLVLHRSRLPQKTEEAGQSWLELWRARAESQGARALGELRHGVEEAIKALGNGFLAHPANDALRQRLKSGEMSVPDYYQELLRLIYRLIFLFVAEERGLLFPTEADPADRRRFMENYSASRLRDTVRKYLTDDRHDDLWRTLRITFGLLSGEKEGMSVPALGGGLFDEESCPNLDGCHLRNDALAEAVRRLSWVRIGRITRRVKYREMDAEELGGVYEGLLEQQPQMVADATLPRFELVGSGERKLTGSYYTPTSLVQELIKSALEPVIAGRLKGKRTVEARWEALLNITVCDPACGSGHFLLAAARRLAGELARVEAGDAEPSPPELRSALREVIANCIYGVDLNPLAVDLCRLALWMEGHDPARPLTFLDSHIKVGNSLIGATAELVKSGVPDGAFDPVTGDDKKTASDFKKLNRKEKDQSSFLGAGGQAWEQLRDRLAEEPRSIDALPELDAVQLAKQRDRYREYRRDRLEPSLLPMDARTAAFFWPLSPGNPEPPTNAAVRRLSAGQAGALTQTQTDLIAHLRARHRFFHWEMEFPVVFLRGGFDCVLGNPPWERIKLQEEEFFATRDPEIAKAPNKAARQKLIDALLNSETGRALYAQFQAAKRAAECESKFVRGGRFPLTAVGDVNLYALFAEHDRSIVNPHGRAGIVVPTGIATDDSTKAFFQDVVDRGSLATLFDFENREGLFPAVDSRMKFSLITLSGSRVPRGDLAFFLTDADQLRDDRRRFQLAPEDFALLNPNTRTCPVFRTKADADLSKSIYRRVLVLVNEKTGENSWGVSFLAMFHMSNDSGLFRTQPGPGLVPLYEGKMVQAFDHRAASVETVLANLKRPGQPHELSASEHQDPDCSPTPQYWVEMSEVTRRCPHRNRIIAYKSVTSPTNERTVIAALLPFTGVAHSMNVLVLLAESSPQLEAAILANLNTIVLDYVAKQKVGGVNLSNFLVKQFPVLPPSAYTDDDLAFIVPRVRKLTYTAYDLKPFAEDVGYDGPPSIWDEDRRAELRADLDAYYAALYGLTRDELRYILDPADVYGPDFPGETFRVLKEKEIKQYGVYRTRRLVLEAWDRLGLEPRNRDGRYHVEPSPFRPSDRPDFGVSMPVEPIRSSSGRSKRKSAPTLFDHPSR